MGDAQKLTKLEARARYREQRSKAHKSRRRSQQRYEPVEACRGPRGRSQSLDAILEELNHPEPEVDQGKGALIPRAKLSVSKGAPGKIYTKRRLSQTYDTTSLHAIHFQVEKKALEKSRSNLRLSTSLPFLDQSEWVNDMEPDRLSNGPPSYSTEFDACMRQLQGIQHDMDSMDEMEITTLPRHVIRDHEDGPRSLTMPRARVQKRQMTPTKDSMVPPPEDTDTDDGCKTDEETLTSDSKEEQVEDLEEEKTEVEEAEEATIALEEKAVENQPQRIVIVEPEPATALDKPKPKIEITQGWYNNLKDQFERLDKELGDRAWKQESSCRIMGATLKNCKDVAPNEENSTGTQRKHYFSQLVRSNKSLIDEELPDPDKVQNIRAMFQEQHARLGGSLQNISTTKPVEVKPERPKSALGSRKEDELKCLGTDSVDGPRRVETASKSGHDRAAPSMEKNRGHPRWTDTGSMSSGVSSDLSSCDTDLESCSRDAEHTLSSDEDLDVVDRHYIQSEILEKIRSFGTSVTYFGGQMIRCSVGPLVSPTTHAILEEIGQKQPNGSAATRSFDEFYKKYKESSKKRKVGRTRSFAQEEMFQKSSVFNNMEIDEHKMELETAFGIRTPKGKAAGVKTKLGKSYSLDSKLQSFENQIAAAGNNSFRKEERTDAVSIPIPQPVVNSSATTKYRVGKEYFDCNRDMVPQKNDMEFEEFEVCENLYDKISRIKRESKERKSIEITQDSGNEGDQEKPQEQGSIVPGDEAAREDAESPRNRKEGLTQSNLTNEENENMRNSVQEKRNSYEEFIQRKRSNDSTGGQSTKVSSSSSNNSSKRNSLDKEKPAVNGVEINEVNSVKQEGSLIREGNSIEDECESSQGKRNSWGLKDGDIMEEFQRSSRRSSSTASKVSAWESFEKSRRYSSTENLNQFKRTSISSQDGSRRNSVKKLTDSELYNKDFCRENKRNSFDSQGSGSSFDKDSRKPFEKEPNRRRSSGSSRRGSLDSHTSQKSNLREETKGLINNEKRRSQGEQMLKEKIIQSSEKKVSEEIINSEKRSSNEQGAKNNKDGNKQTEYKITIKISQSDDDPSYSIGNDQFEEIIINEQDPPDSLELYLPQKENQAEIGEKGIQDLVQDVDGAIDYNRKQKGGRSNQSRWPIETTVVVDMEKTEGTAPKLISNGKSHVKTTKRLY